MDKIDEQNARMLALIERLEHEPELLEAFIRLGEMLAAKAEQLAAKHDSSTEH